MLSKIKVNACYTVKIYKNKPQFFFKPEGGGVPAGPGSVFDDTNSDYILHVDILLELHV